LGTGDSGEILKQTNLKFGQAMSPQWHKGSDLSILRGAVFASWEFASADHANDHSARQRSAEVVSHPKFYLGNSL
jgi:hypothetical protein